MFLRPQHFQQHDRWIEYLVAASTTTLRPFSWGFAEVSLLREHLALGKLTVNRASGIFPDGTPFALPDVDPNPASLDIDETFRDQIVYLSMPLKRPGAGEFSRDTGTPVVTRYQSGEIEVKDSDLSGAESATVEIARPTIRLRCGKESRSDYVSLGLARIVEVKADRTVVLDPAFIPPVLDISASDFLNAFMSELRGLIGQRAQVLAARVSGESRGVVADAADFMLLQVLNRTEPVLAHLASLRAVHPEELFRFTLALAGEAATFSTPEKRAPAFPAYRHEDLQNSFVPLIAELRRALSTVLEQNAIALPFADKGHGYRLAMIADSSLVGSATFVLVASAAVPQEELRRNFPKQFKVASTSQLVNLVNGLLPGIPLSAMAAVPRQMPFYAGAVYFEIDPRSDFWMEIKQTRALAAHIPDDAFPDMKVELWAIRSRA